VEDTLIRATLVEDEVVVAERVSRVQRYWKPAAVVSFLALVAIAVAFFVTRKEETTFLYGDKAKYEPAWTCNGGFWYKDGVKTDFSNCTSKGSNLNEGGGKDDGSKGGGSKDGGGKDSGEEGSSKKVLPSKYNIP